MCTCTVAVRTTFVGVDVYWPWLQIHCSETTMALQGQRTGVDEGAAPAQAAWCRSGSMARYLRTAIPLVTPHGNAHEPLSFRMIPLSSCGSIRAVGLALNKGVCLKCST